MKLGALFAVAAILSGCFAAKEEAIFTKDGQSGYAINCAGQNRNWSKCFEKASELCGNAGYKQHAKNTGRNYERSLIVACKKLIK